MNVSEFRDELVKVETCNGTVEGRLKHVDYYLSNHSKSLRPGCLILENGNRLIIIRTWKIIKKA